MTRDYDSDEMRRPSGTRHPLAGISEDILAAAMRGIRQVSDLIGTNDPQVYEEVVEAILIQLRAGAFLRCTPLFIAVESQYEVDDDGNYQQPLTGGVLDLRHWPNHEDVTEKLFGAASVPWVKARWAAEQLNTDYAVTPQAWERHQETIKESGD